MESKQYYIKLIRNIDQEIDDKLRKIEENSNPPKPNLSNSRYKKKIKYKPNPHLNKFLNEEINRLKQRRLLYERELESFEKYYMLLIDWEWVKFGDGLIIINYPGYPNQTFTIKVFNSRESFNYIHKRIEICLPPINVMCWPRANQMKILKRPEFESIIRYFIIKQKLNEIAKGDIVDFKTFRSKLPYKLEEYFFPVQKSVYLNYLCIKQSEDHKIIPLEERKQVNDSVQNEKSFLFTIKKKQSIYIIWENINEKRATYVFPTSECEYEKKIESIFNYVAHPSYRKRYSLHKETENVKNLGDYAIVNHSEFDTWKSKVFPSIK